MTISRTAAEKPHIRRAMGGTAKLTPLTGTLVVDGDIADFLTTYAPGAVQDYATRSTNEVINNTSALSLTAANRIEGLELNVVGTGRPIELTFWCPNIRHATANQYNGVYLVTAVDGGAENITDRPHYHVQTSPSTTIGRSMTAVFDVDTVEGSDYVFTLGVFGGAAGNVTIEVETSAFHYMTFKARNH